MNYDGFKCVGKGGGAGVDGAGRVGTGKEWMRSYSEGLGFGCKREWKFTSCRARGMTTLDTQRDIRLFQAQDPGA